MRPSKDRTDQGPALIRGIRDLHPARQAATQPRQPEVTVKTEGRTDTNLHFANLVSVPSRKTGVERALANMFGEGMHVVGGEMPQVSAVTISEGDKVTDVYTRIDDNTVIHENCITGRMYLLNDSNMEIGLG